MTGPQCARLDSGPECCWLRDVRPHVGGSGSVGAGCVTVCACATKEDNFFRTTRRYRTVKVRATSQLLTAEDPIADELRNALARIRTPGGVH